MSDPKVLVLGATGMLGSAVVEALELSGLRSLVASRTQGLRFNAEEEKCEAVFDKAALQPGDYVINCVGLTKKYIREGDPGSVAQAVKLNVIFPLDLARTAESSGIHVIQVATDCVFSGRDGQYTEISAHDAEDTYGKTKSLGEAVSESVMHLRCSLIGPELDKRNTLFFEWVRKSPPSGVLAGYLHHRWNGLTSKTFGQIVAGIIKFDGFTSGVQHLVPFDAVTKYELVAMELALLGRTDVKLEKEMGKMKVDRTLSTIKPVENRNLFKLGGFSEPPSIREMMELLPWEQLRIR